MAAGAAAALASAAWAATARADVGLSAAVTSDERVRGVSLSDGDPVASLNLDYDWPGGVYVGLTALAVYQDGRGPRPLGYIADLGYAARSRNGAAWEVGVSNSEIDLTLDQRYAANYTEIYAGLSRGGLSVRLYYSPNYITTSTSTLYAELNGTWRPARQWRVFGHAGLLAPLAECDHGHPGRCGRLDLRAGVARQFSRLELSLAVSATDHAPTYPATYRQSPDSVTVSAAWFF